MPKPSEIAALVPAANDSVCEVLRKYFLFQIKVWQWYKFMYRDEGGVPVFTDEFIDLLCDVPRRCP